MKLVLAAVFCGAMIMPALADPQVEQPITSYSFTSAELGIIGSALQEAAQHRIDLVTRLQQQFRAQTQPTPPAPQPEIP